MKKKGIFSDLPSTKFYRQLENSNNMEDEENERYYNFFLEREESEEDIENFNKLLNFEPDNSFFDKEVNTVPFLQTRRNDIGIVTESMMVSESNQVSPPPLPSSQKRDVDVTAFPEMSDFESMSKPTVDDFWMTTKIDNSDKMVFTETENREEFTNTEKKVFQSTGIGDRSILNFNKEVHAQPTYRSKKIFAEPKVGSVMVQSIPSSANKEVFAFPEMKDEGSEILVGKKDGSNQWSWKPDSENKKISAFPKMVDEESFTSINHKDESIQWSSKPPSSDMGISAYSIMEDEATSMNVEQKEGFTQYRRFMLHNKMICATPNKRESFTQYQRLGLQNQSTQHETEQLVVNPPPPPILDNQKQKPNYFESFANLRNPNVIPNFYECFPNFIQEFPSLPNVRNQKIQSLPNIRDREVHCFPNLRNQESQFIPNVRDQGSQYLTEERNSGGPKFVRDGKSIGMNTVEKDFYSIGINTKMNPFKDQIIEKNLRIPKKFLPIEYHIGDDSIDPRIRVDEIPSSIPGKPNPREISMYVRKLNSKLKE